MTIRYAIGDAANPGLDPQGGNTVIAHIVNNRGGWGRGFVVSLSRRWPRAEVEYRSWYAGRFNGSGFVLGAVQFVTVAARLWVANMVAQDGMGRDDSGGPPIRYPALATCLEEVGKHARSMRCRVAMPRIGTGLAGGEWSVIEAIVRREICERGVDVVVYDLRSRRDRP